MMWTPTALTFKLLAIPGLVVCETQALLVPSVAWGLGWIFRLSTVAKPRASQGTGVSATWVVLGAFPLLVALDGRLAELLALRPRRGLPLLEALATLFLAQWLTFSLRVYRLWEEADSLVLTLESRALEASVVQANSARFSRKRCRNKSRAISKGKIWAVLTRRSKVSFVYYI